MYRIHTANSPCHFETSIWSSRLTNLRRLGFVSHGTIALITAADEHIPSRLGIIGQNRVWLADKSFRYPRDLPYASASQLNACALLYSPLYHNLTQLGLFDGNSHRSNNLIEPVLDSETQGRFFKRMPINADTSAVDPKIQVRNIAKVNACTRLRGPRMYLISEATY